MMWDEDRPRYSERTRKRLSLRIVRQKGKHGNNVTCNHPLGWYVALPLILDFMGRICELTGKRPMKGSIIWRSGKSKKSGGIGTHVTAITKRRFLPNLQRVKAVIDGEVRYIRVSASAIKKGLVIKAPKRTWRKDQAAAKA
jgi:large subunit ribosomal protein L28